MPPGAPPSHDRGALCSRRIVCILKKLYRGKHSIVIEPVLYKFVHIMEQIEVLSTSIIKIENVKQQPDDHSEEEVYNFTEGDELCPLKREMKMEDDEENVVYFRGSQSTRMPGVFNDYTHEPNNV